MSVMIRMNTKMLMIVIIKMMMKVMIRMIEIMTMMMIYDHDD